MIESPTASEMNSHSSNNNSARSRTSEFAEAIEQMRLASTSIFEAVSALRRATTNAAKDKLEEGKEQVKSLESQAEAAVFQRPLLYLGVAFAAGWVIAKITKS